MHLLTWRRLWLCQGPRHASARSQPTRLWWPDSGPCSPVCCSTTRGSCNGPRMGWPWAWVRDSKVSGVTQLAQHPEDPTSGPIAPLPLDRLRALASLLCSWLFLGVCGRALSFPPSFAQTLLFVSSYGLAQKGNKEPERPKETRRSSCKRVQTDTRRAASGRRRGKPEHSLQSRRETGHVYATGFAPPSALPLPLPSNVCSEAENSL